MAEEDDPGSGELSSSPSTFPSWVDDEFCTDCSVPFGTFDSWVGEEGLLEGEAEASWSLMVVVVVTH